jgi:hypothetical protein
MDVYSKDLIISNLEVLLNYCKRFFGRQFLTRSHVDKDVIGRFEEFLNNYFDSGRPEKEGLPVPEIFFKQPYLTPKTL